MTSIDHPDWAGLSTDLGVLSKLFDATVNAGTQSASFDTSAYESIVILPLTGSTAGYNCYVQNQSLGLKVITIITAADSTPEIANELWVATAPGRYNIVNLGSENIRFQVFGTNRRPSTRADGVNNAQAISLSQNFAPPVSGTNYLGLLSGYGRCFSEFIISNSAAKGFFGFQDGNVFMQIADSVEMHTDPFGQLRMYKEWICPRDLVRMYYYCAVVANTVATVNTVFE